MLRRAVLAVALVAALVLVGAAAARDGAARGTPTGGAAGQPPPGLYAALDRWNKDLAKLIEQIDGGHLTQKGLEHKLGLAHQEGFAVAHQIDVDMFGSSFADTYDAVSHVTRDLLDARNDVGSAAEERRAAIERLVSQAEASWSRLDFGTKAGSIPEVRTALEEISTLADDVKAQNLTQRGTGAAIDSAMSAVDGALKRFPAVYGLPFTRWYNALSYAQRNLEDAGNGADALSLVQAAKNSKDSLEKSLPKPASAAAPAAPPLTGYWQPNNNSILDFIVRFDARGGDSYAGVYDGDKGYPCDVGKTLYDVTGSGATYRGKEHTFGPVWKDTPTGHYECEAQGTHEVTVTLAYDATAGVGNPTGVAAAYRGWHLDVGGTVFNPISAADAARYHH